MTKSRLEAFSDGVLAIIITIMVLELKIPHDASWKALSELWPVVLSYIMSFSMIGIYWGNHHHLLHTIKEVNSGIMWANLHLLFWLSLIPFGTGWMGENHFSPNTIALYALLCNCCGIAYYILLMIIKDCNKENNALLKNLYLQQSKKGMLSLAIYTAAIPLAYVNVWIPAALITITAIIWFFPDRNIERSLKN